MLKLGIIGHPLGHTLSPTLHGFLMEQLGIEGEYRSYPTPPEALGEQIKAFQAQGLRGFNVTIPHKVAILPFLDTMSETARIVQAVNTVIIQEGKLRGENTDISGFLRSLPDTIQETLPHREVLILGAGGAARAVLVAFLQAKVASITLLARSPEKAQALLALAWEVQSQTQSKTEVKLQSWQELNTLAPYPLLINTTPMGMAAGREHPTEMPIARDLLETLPPGAFVYDLIYRPLETALIHQAKALGYSTQGGLEMLIYQGIEAFQYWTDTTISANLAAVALAHVKRFLE